MEKLNKFTKFFRKIYYQTFVESFKGKLTYNFPQNYHRWDLIEYLIEKNNYSDYLEIGCDQDQLFSKIRINNKKGVDPVSGGNIRKTSDDFFQANDEMFDIIFIDGLHTYDQVKKDILNSVDFELEYGKATIEVHKDSINEKDSVLIIDDLIATGGTAEAAAKLIEISKGNVAAFIFVINLFDLNGSDNLINKGYKVENLIEFPGH